MMVIVLFIWIYLAKFAMRFGGGVLPFYSWGNQKCLARRIWRLHILLKYGGFYRKEKYVFEPT